MSPPHWFAASLRSCRSMLYLRCCCRRYTEPTATTTDPAPIQQPSTIDFEHIEPPTPLDLTKSAFDTSSSYLAEDDSSATSRSSEVCVASHDVTVTFDAAATFGDSMATSDTEERHGRAPDGQAIGLQATDVHVCMSSTCTVCRRGEHAAEVVFVPTDETFGAERSSIFEDLEGNVFSNLSSNVAEDRERASAPLGRTVWPPSEPLPATSGSDSTVFFFEDDGLEQTRSL